MLTFIAFATITKLLKMSEQNNHTEEIIEKVIELIESKTGYPSVFTTWDKGVADGVTQELVKDIRETFGVPKKCLPFGRK